MQTNKELAQAIIEAARRREASFDHAAAARCGCGPAESFYVLTIREAAEADGVNPLIAYPVYLLLSNCWNNALEWAALNK